jgi:cbb3-type cytochrome oxidase subunit 1
VLSISFYYEQIKKPEALFIYSLPEFWYVTGVFLHASGTFFIYIFANLWLENKSYIVEYTIIHSVLSIINNLLITFSVWKQFREPSLIKSKTITA